MKKARPTKTITFARSIGHITGATLEPLGNRAALQVHWDNGPTVRKRFSLREAENRFSELVATALGMGTPVVWG